MEMAGLDRTIPFQSIEALARLSENVIRDFLWGTRLIAHCVVQGRGL